MQFVKKSNFLKFNDPVASYSSVKTCWTRLVSSSGARQNMMIESEHTKTNCHWLSQVEYPSIAETSLVDFQSKGHVCEMEDAAMRGERCYISTLFENLDLAVSKISIQYPASCCVAHGVHTFDSVLYMVPIPAHHCSELRSPMENQKVPSFSERKTICKAHSVCVGSKMPMTSNLHISIANSSSLGPDLYKPESISLLSVCSSSM